MQRSIAVVVFLLMPAVADAGVWYYTWRCSGQCAPDRLGIEGVEGPFATEAQCETVRASDGRKDTFIGPGNLGGLDFCHESDGTGAPARSFNPIAFQRFQVAADGGAGWRLRDAAGAVSPGSSTGGVDLDIILGAHPLLGVDFGVGVQRTSITAPFYGSAPKSMLMIPWTMGFTSSPSLVRGELRLDLAADVVFVYRNGCSNCNDSLTSGFGYELRAGVDYFPRGHYGFGFDAVFMFAKMGDTMDPVEPTPIEIAAPPVLFRLSVSTRNQQLPW